MSKIIYTLSHKLCYFTFDCNSVIFSVIFMLFVPVVTGMATLEPDDVLAHNCITLYGTQNCNCGIVLCFFLKHGVEYQEQDMETARSVLCLELMR